MKVLVEEKTRDAEETARKVCAFADFVLGSSETPFSFSLTYSVCQTGCFQAASKDAKVESLKEQLRRMQEELGALKSAKVQLEARNAEMRRELDQAREHIEIVERENHYHEDENREQVDQVPYIV